MEDFFGIGTCCVIGLIITLCIIFIVDKWYEKSNDYSKKLWCGDKYQLRVFPPNPFESVIYIRIEILELKKNEQTGHWWLRVRDLDNEKIYFMPARELEHYGYEKI